MPTASWSRGAAAQLCTTKKVPVVESTDSVAPQLCSTESQEVIYDALDGHLHQVQVRAQDEIDNESHWSDWSPLRLERPWKGQAESSASRCSCRRRLDQAVSFQPP